MNRPNFLTILAVTAATCAVPSLAKSNKTAAPNFLFILADDLGARDLSIEASTYYESPNIDRIATEGMRFTNGYAACQVCSPSRASIMTGKYTPRHGITDWIGAKEGFDWKRNTKLLPAKYNWRLAHGDVTVAEALRQAGYKTFFAGKWHLGDRGSWPEDHGFDINIAGWDKGSPMGGYFSPYRNPNIKDGPKGESLPIRLGRETARFISEHKDQRFLAYLSFYSVHGPIQTTHEKWAKYRKKAMAKPHEGSRFIIDRTMPVRQVQDCPIYAGMIEAMDQAVGIVLDKLDELGMADSTVVIFTSDNGGVSSGDAYSSCNLPFRGGKGRQWEGGIREPYYIKAPGIARPGTTSATPVIGTDFYPTILELAGLPLRPAQHVDGVSLVPLLKGGSIAPRDLFWHYPHYGNQGGEPSSIIRSGDWKLIHYWEDGRDELYNVSRDVGEQRDVSNDEPQIRTSLRSKLDEWIEQTGARLPQLNPRYDDKLADRQKRDMRTQRLAQLENQHAGFLKPDFKPNATWWGSTPD
ncbi:MAG: sulfatase [Planctomycetota bacterium]|jgi:arylsulfatase A-like enzyme